MSCRPQSWVIPGYTWWLSALGPPSHPGPSFCFRTLSSCHDAHAMFFHFSFLPVFPWTHSGPLVLMTLSKGGADLLIFLTLFLPSHPSDLRQDDSCPVVLPLCNFSPTLPHRICSHYPFHNKDWASCFKTLHPTFWGLFFFFFWQILTVFLWLITLDQPHWETDFWSSLLCFRLGPYFRTLSVNLVYDFSSPPCAISADWTWKLKWS